MMLQLRRCIALLLVFLWFIVARGQEAEVLLRELSRELDEIIDVTGFLDTQECYDALIAADANGDRRITADEYVTVVQLMGPDGFLSDVTDFADLPFRIKTTFTALACLCSRAGGASDCCVGDNAHINNLGAGEGETPTPEQSAYLFTVCLATIRSIESVLAPSPEPSAMPSILDVPTAVPSVAPTELVPLPSASPSVSPTTPPTAPSQPPTLAPSSSPSNPGDTPAPTITNSPTQSPRIPVPVAYIIQVPNGANVPLTGTEIDDLEAAMDIMAPQVADEVFNSNRRLRRRRLDVTVELPTSIIGTFQTACPAGAPAQDDCRDVSASVTITEDEEESAEEVQATFAAALDEAINNGDLEAALLQVNPNSRVVVESPISPPSPSPSPVTDSGLSAGATAGIAVAAVATFLAAAGLLVARKKRLEKDDAYYAAGTHALADADQNARDARELKAAGDTGAAPGSMLGATQADYGKKSKQAVQTSVVAFDTLEDDDIKVKGDDESSNAGSSGWSSSAGVSSLNTGSADSLDFTGGQAVGATLAAIGAASAISSRQDSKKAREGGVPNVPSVSREDLDSAIEAGDWAAVGATAALLAAASDSPDTGSQSASSRSHSSRSGRTGSSAVSSIDAARAAELDHLVDAGDWEGVVLAAAKFEASEEGSKGSSASASASVKSGSESRSIGGSTGAASSGMSPSVSDSESPSKQQKRAEIRAEVEALVRRVVPEEIDNVDEMMLQFKGREEELVETLRTMQERAVAQKARVQGQKAAKREARNIVQQGGVELPVPGAAATTEGLSPAEAAGVAAGAAAAMGVSAGIAAGIKKKKEEEEAHDLSDISSGEAPVLVHEDTSKSDSGSASGTSSGKRRTALEMAIEAGDWEAVGEAAAMISDTSVTTASTTEVQALAEGVSYEEEDTDVRRMKRAGVNADRAAELDAMIDAGNWTGVVAAASRYSKVDVQTEESSDSSASESREGPGRKRSWFGGSSLLDKKPAATTSDQAMDVDSTEWTADEARREEEDALAQAEIWMAIANQSKQEGSTDVGASDAADWAIARSLSALRSAEARGELSQPAKGDGPPDEASGSVGEADSKGDRSV